MKDRIIQNINNSKELEKLFKENKNKFKKEFKSIYPQYVGKGIMDEWNGKLNGSSYDIFWGTSGELIFVISLCLLCGFFVKLPSILSSIDISIDVLSYFQKNFGFFIFSFPSIYLLWKRPVLLKHAFIILTLTFFTVFYINYIIANISSSDIDFLVIIHLPFFLWLLFGYAYIANDPRHYLNKINFLRFSGDMMVLTFQIIISGIMVGLTTFILFFILGESSIAFYFFQYVLTVGFFVTPIVASYVISSNPLLVGKVTSAVAKIFTPIVSIILLVYFVKFYSSSGDNFWSKDFLFTFNLMLLAVVGLILFALGSSSKHKKYDLFSLLFMSIITFSINAIALINIIVRLFDGYGITANRVVILGLNLLMLINLFFISFGLASVLQGKKKISFVEKSISTMLLIYFMWLFFVIFILPIIFR